jgi:hypothetical protein
MLVFQIRDFDGTSIRMLADIASVLILIAVVILLAWLTRRAWSSTRALLKLVEGVLAELLTLLRDLGVGLHHGGFAEGLFIQIGKQFCRAFQRDEMADVEIDRLRLQMRPVLDRLRDRTETFPC